MTEEQKTEITELRQNGHGYKSIAAETGIPLSTVVAFFKRIATTEKSYCEQCGSVLKIRPHTKTKRFCSDQCRMLWWNSHKELVNRKAFYKFICPNCGRPFIAYGNAHRVYCSRKCLSAAQSKAKKNNG